MYVRLLVWTVSLPVPTGSNGHEFMFLLKGHEDLRQDERVMQLFGLVNTLLANDPASLRKNLRHVKVFCVILSIIFGLSAQCVLVVLI